MFNFFNKKKFGSKKDKLSLINAIEGIEKNTEKANLYKLNARLDEISNVLDNESLVLTKEQVSSINDCLNLIGKHSNKAYEDFLMNKCDQIKNIISGNEKDLEKLKLNMKNEDQLLELLGDLTSIDGQIRSIDKEMNDVLGKNRKSWELLNTKKKILQNTYAIKNKNYQTLNNNMININLAADVRESKKEAESILSQSALVDVSEFTENVESITDVQNEVDDITNKMNDTFSKNFGAGTTDSDYDKALEEKLLNDTQNNSLGAASGNDVNAK